MSAKKVIALACSPSKGFNSDTMLDAFIEGLKTNPKIEVEKVYLVDVPNAYYTFFNRIPDPEKEPEIAGLIDRITKADGLIIGAPTFNFSVPAMLKNLFDRMSFAALDYKNINWLGQPTGKLTKLNCFYLVSAGTPWYFLWLVRFQFPIFWLRCLMMYFGAKTRGGIYGAGINAKNLAKDNPPLLKRCRNAGARFAKKI